MLRSMYTSITGLRNHQAMLDVTANNIGNVNTYGFKGSRMTFKTLLSQTISSAAAPSANLGGTNSKQVGMGMTVDSTQQQMMQGTLATTSVPTDFALDGEGFFRVTNDPAGMAGGTQETLYTRAGNFNLDANGDMVTQDGLYVIGYADDGTGNPDPAAQTVLNIDPATTAYWQVGQDGLVTRMDTGTGTVQNVGWITVSKFANPTGLESVGGNRWRESQNSGAPIDTVGADGTIGVGTINQGFLEMSNVDLATEFTDMIRAQRGFQANSRVITTSDEILQELVNLKR